MTEYASDNVTDMTEFYCMLWIDKESFSAIKYVIDLSPIMDELGTKLEPLDAHDTGIFEEIKSKDLKVTLTLENVNEIENFKIPEELLEKR